MKNEVEIQSGTSLVVRQFVAFVRGEDVPHEPSNPWIVQRVAPTQQYCLTCCGVRWFDVIQAVTVDGKPLAISICRCCGAEV